MTEVDGREGSENEHRSLNAMMGRMEFLKQERSLGVRNGNLNKLER